MFVNPRLEHLAAKFNKIKVGYGYGDILFRQFERSLISEDKEDNKGDKGFNTWADKILSQSFLSETKKKVDEVEGV